ncbi:substrate-binding domain-containing protein [Peribacillus sp. TH16]|uniref:substrate-binding domain-containing protein n=1 Tax=Peribacillus sp. TH16 TaxID=2798482 RepID=UPI00191302B7|nr:substrate-binding domain-containing protein [Peribacillus sp. TH16]MBK5482574.1 substrate-binding domain-containing protein [Peribacillus sp. TH16]
MKKKSYIFSAIIISSALALAACGNQDASTKEGGKDTTKTATIASTGDLMINPKVSDKKVMDKGPYGETAVSAKTLKLTEKEIEKIKAGKYKAAIVMHYSGTDYMTAQVNAMKASLKRMGIEVVAVTDAQFKAEKQVSDIETVLAKKPDVMISVPVDPVSTAPAFKKAAQQGVKLVFMDGVAQGLKPGKEYISAVSGDNRGNGAAAADIMAEKLGKKGNVGIVFHDADFFVTKNRTDAFEETMREKYPNIEIVARGGITGPNDGEKVASAMLTRNKDINGIFVVWDVPAEGVVAAARTAGKDDLVVTTTDLGTNVGLEIASEGIVKGLGGQLPFDQGVAESILAGYALLGKEAPAYVATPALSVTKENVLDSWKLIYGVDAPEIIQNAAE